MTALLDADARRKVHFVASMAVQARRAMGKNEATIRREALDVAGKAIPENVDDLVVQESWFAELEKAVDREIRRTRVEGQG
jgi:hypothetical protein